MYGISPYDIIPSKIVAMFLQMCMDGVEVDTEDRFSGLGTLVVRKEGENETKCNVEIAEFEHKFTGELKGKKVVEDEEVEEKRSGKCTGSLINAVLLYSKNLN